MKPLKPYPLAAALVVTPLGSQAFAHALAQRYDLPLPLGYFLAACGFAVALSFLVLSILLSKEKAGRLKVREVYPQIAIPFAVVVILRVLAVATAGLLVLAGLIGNPGTFKNITPVAFWVIWWVGFGFFVAFVGNAWPMINPLVVVFDWGERAWPKLKTSPFRAGYPKRLGAWPACALLALFAWFELVAPARDVPANIAIAIIIYSFFTWTGLAAFGRESWLQGVEVFSLFFGTLGRFAPLVFEQNKGRWYLGIRPYAAGLLADRPLTPSMSAFVLLMLGTVSVDGIMETPQWSAVVDWALSGRAAQFPSYAGVQTVLLVAGPIVLGCLYLTTTALMAWLSGARFAEVSGLFVLSLVPIAIVYHLAHYFSLFAVAGQFIIPLISDPFGFGWDLFGTTLYRIDIGIVDAKTVWYLSVLAIVTGHVIAVWLGHATAAVKFSDTRVAVRSQYPMVVLMVGYTTLSLWILAQPIVEAGSK